MHTIKWNFHFYIYFQTQNTSQTWDCLHLHVTGLISTKNTISILYLKIDLHGRERPLCSVWTFILLCLCTPVSSFVSQVTAIWCLDLNQYMFLLVPDLVLCVFRFPMFEVYIHLQCIVWPGFCVLVCCVFWPFLTFEIKFCRYGNSRPPSLPGAGQT